MFNATRQLISRTVLIAMLASVAPAATAAEAAVVIPAPTKDEASNLTGLQKAIFAGGCFWGVQGVFEHVRGVKKVYSGYAGGDADTAHYELVGSGKTGHAESVEITYDPTQVSYGELLHVFFSVAHNPTQLNYQGPDRGTQYRSAIFYTSASQKEVAQTYMDQLTKAKAFAAPIVTQLNPLQAFYKAEDYHQDFLIHNPRHPYIMVHDLPKIVNLKKIFAEQYQARPVKVTDKLPE